MNLDILNFKGKIYHFFFLHLGIFLEIVRPFKRYLKRGLFYFRHEVIAALAENQPTQIKRPRVMVSIPHITSIEEAKDREKAVVKIERLKNTIDGILSSLAHCDLTIVISTLPGRHITAYLPEYQINCISVKEEPECDPMYVEFRIQDEFMEKLDEFDWFLFIEDDIILSDSFILEKLEKFNLKFGDGRSVLFPNRYEMWESTKRYIDLTIMNSDKIWNGISTVEIEGVKFAECANPHAALYCLSKHQMKIWSESEREWKNKVFAFGGPLEAAATYSLLECFSLYKPHPSNLHFFEVKHYDTKYSQLYPEPSPYALSPIKKSSKAN